MPFARESLAGSGEAVIGAIGVFFVETSPATASVNGVAVLSEADFFALPAETTYFNVAIGGHATRRQVAERCLARGFKPRSLRAVQSVVYDTSSIGEGAIICPFATITANATIGKFFHANIYSYVAHDCVIGDYVTFAPNVQCNGNVHVGDGAYIGTGAIIRNGLPSKPLTIGEYAVVGMGAVVTKDVPPGATVIGNPARPIARNP